MFMISVERKDDITNITIDGTTYTDDKLAEDALVDMGIHIDLARRALCWAKMHKNIEIKIGNRKGIKGSELSCYRIDDHKMISQSNIFDK